MIDPEHPVLYAETIRDLDLVLTCGARIVGLTQHDKDEYLETGETYMELHLDTGDVLRLYGTVQIEHPDGSVTTFGTRTALADDGEAEDSVE